MPDHQPEPQDEIPSATGASLTPAGIPHEGSDLLPGGSDLLPGGSDLLPGGSDFPPGGSDLLPGGSDFPPGGSDFPPGGSDLPPRGNDLPPDDEAFLYPDPDTGPPVELLSLTDQELYDLLENTPAQPAPPTWPPPISTWPPFGNPSAKPGNQEPPGGASRSGRDAWPLRPQAAGASAAPGTENLSRGFGEGGVLDGLPAGTALAGFADDAYCQIADLDDDCLIGVLRSWRRVTSWAQAREFAMVAELARRRPADGTPPASGPGQFPDHISEFAADEVGLALTLTKVAAHNEFALAMDLAHRPAIAAALESGQIDLPKARILISMICVLEPAHADAVEAAILPKAPGLTTGELRAALLRAILRLDPDAARRRQEEAQKEARVERWTDPEGTASLAGRSLPPAEVLAADKRLCTIAKAWKKQGAQGGMDLLRAHVYLALLLGQPTDTPPLNLLPADTPMPPPPGPAAKHAGPAADHAGPPADHAGPAADHAGPAADHAGPAADRAGPAADQTGPAAEHADPGHDPDPGPGRRPGQTFGAPGPQDGALPAGLRQPSVGVPLPPLTGEVNITIPMLTLLGLADRPGEAAGFGPLHADTARRLADAMATNRRARWGVIITNQDGHAVGYAPSVRARPLSTGGWKITLTTEPIAPYP